MNRTVPARGFAAQHFYQQSPFGVWLLFAEIVIFGLLPAILLCLPRARRRRVLLLTGAALACAGIALNRFVLTVQTLALPTLPFERFNAYWPSWQEYAAAGAVVAYAVLVYSFSFRYLTLFPQERELSPEKTTVKCFSEIDV